jgi:hypothetical protein
MVNFFNELNRALDLGVSKPSLRQHLVVMPEFHNVVQIAVQPLWLGLDDDINDNWE